MPSVTQLIWFAWTWPQQPLPFSVLLIKKWTTITQVTTLQLARDTSLVSSISYRKRSKRDLDDGFERVLIKHNFYGEERHRELGDSFQLLMVWISPSTEQNLTIFWPQLILSWTHDYRILVLGFFIHTWVSLVCQHDSVCILVNFLIP